MMVQGSITFQPVRKNNIDLVAEIYGACFDEPWPRPVVEDLFSPPVRGGCLLVRPPCNPTLPLDLFSRGSSLKRPTY